MKGLATLGDFFPDKQIRCEVRGCGNLCDLSGEDEPVDIRFHGRKRSIRMCEECRRKYAGLQDKQLPCSRPDCASTRTYTAYEQLESAARGHKEPPAGFCPECARKARETADREVPCRIRSCEGTWTWSAKRQLQQEGDKPPARMCDDCFRLLKTLEDRDVPCRLRGCEQTWHWNRFQQLDYLRQGKSLDKPPRRMCDDCYQTFKQLNDLQLPCKVDECEQTWNYTAYAQLEHRLQHGADAAPPSKMCPTCYKHFLTIRDRKVRCSTPGCRNTWTYTRNMQMHDWHRGKTEPPQHRCASCREKLEKAEPRDVPCMMEGCTNLAVYSPEDQVRDACMKRRKPSPRRCEECERFLASHQAVDVPCRSCGKPIHWSAVEQRLCELGTFVKPSLCPLCAEQELALKSPQPVERPHHHVVRMPKSGKWAADEQIAKWPPHITHDTLTKAEEADLRIVAFGDDLTYSDEEATRAWPLQVEEILNRNLQNATRIAVINAGMPGTTSRQGLARFDRDVTPFAPQLVVFSFTFGDSLLTLGAGGTSWKPAIDDEESAQAMKALCRKLKKLDCPALYWTSNPIFPGERNDGVDNVEMNRWAKAQQQRKNQCLARNLRICRENDIPVLDLRSRFEVNGRKSARKWMQDWYMPNQTGTRNIAVWMAHHLTHNGFLPAD